MQLRYLVQSPASRQIHPMPAHQNPTPQAAQKHCSKWLQVLRSQRPRPSNRLEARLVQCTRVATNPTLARKPRKDAKARQFKGIQFLPKKNSEIVQTQAGQTVTRHPADLATLQILPPQKKQIILPLLLTPRSLLLV